MTSIKGLIETMEKEFERQVLSNTSFEPVELYEPIKYILSNGGKRIRATLVLIGAHFFGDYKQAINQALGIEILHNFTLLHDDIMDNASLRRGKETVHVKWNENTAILSGDAMVFLANKFILKNAGSLYNEILDLYNQTALEVCEGQQLDMNLEALPLHSPAVSSKNYLEMIKLKTSVLIASSLKIGALTVGADSNSANKLYEYGLNIGLAFQLQDDLLDTFGSESSFGKKIGGDILEQKKTFLITSLLEKLSESEKQNFIAVFNQQNQESRISEVKDWLHKYSIKEHAEKAINNYFLSAEKVLNELNVSTEKKELLVELTESLHKRKA